jgi:tetratricopeptide (TPR) repeat protein
VRSPRTPVADDSQPQTPVEYAAELYERGCTHELSGDTIGALRLFDAAIRVDGQVRYLRRAAECALSGDEGRAAETYATKAAALEPLDASIQRLLARVFRAAGRFGDAEEVLLMAMQLKVDSDALVRELRADLADVRRQLARNA